MAKKWWEILAVFLLLLLLAIVSTYPLIRYFDTGIPYSPFGGATVWNRSGDQIQLMYWFWLVKENFLGNVPFDSNPFEFNMGIPYETSGLNTIPLAFLYMLFSPFGDVTAYNCTILSSYVLAGLFMYLLVRLYSGSRTGALLAAIIFTFAPSRIRGFTAGHGYGLLFFCYPFILYYLERGIRSAKIRYGIISSIGLIGLSMLEPHLIYYFCVFLGLYIPVRVLSMFPVYRQYGSDIGAFYFTRPLLGSFLLLWGAGAAVTVYAQAFFSCRDNVPFFTSTFWWVLALYPLIIVLISLCFTAAYQRLSNLDFRESSAVEAKSLLPLFLFLPLALTACYGHPVNTGFLVAASLAAVMGLKVWLLRSHLFSMLNTLGRGIWAKKRMIVPVLPLVFSMGGIVYWMSSSKVEKVASTIAGGGRTLDDVGLFSARLSDLFSSISNVYIGLVPALLGGGLLLVLLATSVFGKQRWRFVDDATFLRLFYLVVAFCCLILSLGLAFGKVSLYTLFFHYFPFFHYPRVSDRIITLALFALAIIAGFVVRDIQQRWQGRIGSAAVTLLIFTAIGFQIKDYNTFKPMGVNVLDRGQDIYSYVKKNIGNKLLLEVPLWPGDSHQSSLYQHYIMLDRVPRINGCSPMVLTEYIDTVFEPLASINQGRIDREQFELLHKLGVKYLTVHDNRDIFLEKVSPFSPLTTVRRLQNSPYFDQIHMDNALHFKTWKKANSRLYLFQLKSMEQVHDPTEQAWYEMPYFYDVNSRLHKQIGQVVKDKMLGKNIFQATEGQDNPGFLVYGPYDVYSPGEYRSYFSISIDGQPDAVVAKIEVVSVEENGGVSVLAQQELKGKNEEGIYKKEFIDFSIMKDTKLEFRVFFYGKGQVRVEKIAVNKIGHDTQLSFLKAEMMVGDTGQVVLAEDAITGKVIEAISGKSKKGDMVYGPNRIYSKGPYTARFLLRMKDSQKVQDDATVAIVSVTDGQNLRVFSRHTIKARELSSMEFTGIETEYELMRDEDLSFHVRFTGEVSVQFDGIQIQKQ
jgi:hypothetical protein